MTYGKRLRFIRKFRGMTQAELGTACEFGKHGHIYIAMYESDSRTPRKDKNERIAKALNVSPKVLMWDTECPHEDIVMQLCWAFILPELDYPLSVTNEVIQLLRLLLDDSKDAIMGDISEKDYIDQKIQLMNVI